MRFSKTGRKTSSVAAAMWHIAPSCWNQMLPISSSSISVQHVPIAIAIEYNGHSFFIFEEKWYSYASGPKSAPNSDSFRVRRLINVCYWLSVPQRRQNLPTRQNQNEHNLDNFFLLKTPSSVSWPQVHLVKL